MYRFIKFVGILITTILIFSEIAFADNTIVTQEPYYSRQYYNNNYYNAYRHNQNLADMEALEKYAFNRSYRGESSLQRLRRLERESFGAIQQGDFDTRYENVKSAILSRPKQNYKTSILKSIGDYFTGKTGFFR